MKGIYDISHVLPGFSVHIKEIVFSKPDQETIDGSFDVYGYYLESTHLAASFWRRFSPPDIEDRWTVTHVSFDTEEEYQCRGIATTHVESCFERYPRIGIRHILLPAVGKGRTFWLRFGFAIVADEAKAFEDMVRQIYIDKLGYTLEGDVPIGGKELLEFEAPYCQELGRVALERNTVIVLEKYL